MNRSHYPSALTALEAGHTATGIRTPEGVLLTARGIPLHHRDGTVRAFTMVDFEDFDRFGGDRWCIRETHHLYVVRHVRSEGRNQRLYLHREIMGLRPGDPLRVDHINRDTLDHPMLIADVREALIETGLPYVIENVEGAKAHMVEPVTICGLSVGCNVRRHRLFESNFPIMVPPCGDHSGDWLLVFGHSVLERGTVVGKAKGGGNTIKRNPATTARGREAMGIDWMTRDELSESIPPAYTELIGHQLMAVVNSERAAA